MDRVNIIDVGELLVNSILVSTIITMLLWIGVR